jgi:thiol-disulfide isomerase/thioredoxin
MNKTIKQLIVFISIVIILNVTGLMSEVTGTVQRAILFTGIMNTDAEELKEPKKADYNLQLKSLDGQIVSLKDYKGKTIFLNLWASWCGPCIAEMPNINALYKDVRQKDIVFVMLSLDDDPEKAKKFIERKGFDFPAYTPAGNIPAVYRSGSIPTTHVISPEGMIVFTKKGTANYDTRKFRRFLEGLREGR